MATLTYVYADSTAVLGPLATFAEPHGYDLCDLHAGRLTAPRGWQVIRLADNFEAPPPTPDDLEALADAVREAARPRVPHHTTEAAGDAGAGQAAEAASAGTSADLPGTAAAAAARRAARHPHLRSVPPLDDTRA